MEEMENILKSKNIDIHRKHSIAKIINLDMLTKFVTNYILLVFYKQNELQYMRFLKKIYQSILSNDFTSFDSDNYNTFLTKLRLDTHEEYILGKINDLLKNIPHKNIEKILTNLKKNINHVIKYLPNIILEYIRYIILKYIILFYIIVTNFKIPISNTILVLLSFYSKKVMYIILLFDFFKQVHKSYQDHNLQSQVIFILQKYFGHKKKVFHNSFQLKINNNTLFGTLTKKKNILQNEKDILQSLQQDQKIVHIYGNTDFNWIELLKLQSKRKNKCIVHVNTNKYIILKTKFQEMDMIYKKAQVSKVLLLKILNVFILKYVYSLIFFDWIDK
jgi:hypothetical protein